MASRKKESEGIALLSIYGDDDDEMEDAEDEPGNLPSDSVDEEIKDSTYTVAEDDEDGNETTTGDFGSGSGYNDNTSKQRRASDDNSTPKTSNLGTSTPQQSELPLCSPPPDQLPAPDSRTSRKGTLTIVDYDHEHDEVAISPRAEEGEIVGTGRVMFGEELQTANGDFQERTSSGTIQASTPIRQATPRHLSEQQDLLLSDPMMCDVNESESMEADGAVNGSSAEPKEEDPLYKFLPPPPKSKCSRELQEKIIKFLSLKKTTGRSFNAEVRNRKEYRNPDFLLHAVTYQDIDQIGSCFCKDVFDPIGYDKSDYYDEIEADMKREMERKEQERKKSQKVDFVSGGTHPGTVGSAPNINIPIPGLSTMISGGLQCFPPSGDVVGRDGRQNKKSKWDKVDIDQRNPLLSGGQDSISAVGAHAALLSAANAGAGYTAFAQQRRREAEDKRSSEKKLDRRS